SPAMAQIGDSGSLAPSPPTRTVTRAISSPSRASARQNPSSLVANSNLPSLSVRPVSAGRVGWPGARARASGAAVGVSSAVANCVVTRWRTNRTTASAGGAEPARTKAAARAAWRKSEDRTLCIPARRYGISAMKVTIFGAGAVGGHVAAKLGEGAAAAGIELSAVGRGAPLTANPERGGPLWLGEERHNARSPATESPATLV